MPIISLTQIGDNLASHPSPNPSLPMQVLSYLRRSGYSASGEKLAARFYQVDKRTLNEAIQTLVANEAVTVSGG